MSLGRHTILVLRETGLFAPKIWLLSGALAISGLCGCKKTAETVDVSEVSVKAERPEQGDISEHIMADATLSPLAQAAISPKITAPVRRFYVQRGSPVRSGQLLAVLENSDLAAAALDNKGSYAAAQAAFHMQTEAQVPEDYQKAQLDVAQSKATLDLNQSIVSARRQLFAQGAIPGRDLDMATAALVQANAAYDAATRHLQSLQMVSRKATLEQAEGQLTSAKGKYAGAEAQVSYSEIRSPIDGIVTDRTLFTGETAAAGSALLTVMDTSALLAKLHLSQIMAQRLKLGDDATVMVPGVAEPIPARVALISPALDPGSTTVEIWLRIDNRDGSLKAGTPVRTSITGRTVPAAIKIPLAAVLTAQDGSKSVMRIGSDGTAHRKSVKLGIQNGEEVQVLSGLVMSDLVITEGAYGLDDGTKVSVAKDEDEKPAAGQGGQSK
ncbi:efflux RND transporter periplasmic adaptor subunit [Granulicella sp. dw_53]|uniref:efflux RND transporter periplasmic adaptor subunit n=1 Tax=Granulicella sp. dw_53 TaxID=2719792 RepID=UPI0031F6796C